MNGLKTSLRILGIIVFLAASAFIPTEFQLEAPEIAQLTGHGNFIQNVGQFRGGEFLLRTELADFWISANDLRISQLHPGIRGNDETRLIQENYLLEFAGANDDAVIEPFGRLDTALSYLIGSDPAGWQVNVPVWSGLRVLGLYPGIDLIIYGATSDGQLDWAWETQPGADLSSVKLVATGMPSVITLEGDLQLSGVLGTLYLDQPIEKSNEVTDAGNAEIGLENNIPLVIDDLATSALFDSDNALQWTRSINFMSYLGGTGVDKAYGISSESGFAYVTGYSHSIDFPVTGGVVDTTLVGSDAFVAKVNSDGTGLLFATFLGGEVDDIGYDIAVENGLAFVTGKTNSTSFPGLAPWENRDYEVFVVSLNAAGTGIRYAKRFGGTVSLEPDEAYGIAVEAGNAYITGLTHSSDLNGVPTLAKGDIFVVKLDPTGITQYNKIFGEGSLDVAYDIAVSGGVAYITGESNSKFFMGPFPAGYEGFVLKVNAVGAMEWITVLSGSGSDRGNGIGLDRSGNIYVAGATDSENFLSSLPANLPFSGNDDGYIVRLTMGGVPDFRTFIGGAGHDRAFALAVDSLGGVQVTGETASSNFPVTPDAFQSQSAGSTDVFVARVMPNSSPLLDFSSYLGGVETDAGRGLGVDLNGSTMICGETNSSNFPVAGAPFDTTYGGAGDGYLGKLVIGPVPGVVLKKYTNDADADLPPGPHLLFGSMVNWTYWIANTGPMELSNVAVTDSTGIEVICPKNTLNQGETMTCTASGSATLGQYSNIGSVAANPPGGLPAVTASDPSHYFGAQPSIQMVKKTNGVNSNIGPGPDILVGSVVNWTYEVTNTGNVHLTNVVVTDSDLTLILSCTGTILAPGSSLTCNASGVAVGGNYENTATVTANPPDGLPAVSTTDVDHYHGVGPDVQITKDISFNDGGTWLPADVVPDPTLLLGYAPKFRITVTNNGDVPLANILVTDSVHNLSGCGYPTSLGIGASFPCTITGTWEAGTNVSIASISADYTDPYNNKMTVTDSNSARYFGAQIGISVEKEISLDNQLTWLDANDPVGQTLLNNGAVPRYRITTHNTSNIPLNVSLADSPFSLPGECAPGILQADDGMADAGLDQRICLVTGTWAAGPQLNTATASVTFTDSGGHTVAASDYDSANYFGASPGLTITFDISLNNANSWLDGSITPIPTLLSEFNPLYRLTILNNGNVRIEGIQVTDDELPLMGCETPVNLDSGSFKVCTAVSGWSFGAQEVNVSTHAEFSDSQGNSWTANDAKLAHYFGAVPMLSLTNEISLDSGATWLPADTAPGPYLLEDPDQPQFRLTVTNSGNVALTASMIDSGFSLLPGCANGPLAPSASRQCTITVGWTSGNYQNTATATAIYVDTAGHSRNVSDDDLAFYFGAWPMLILEKYISGDNGQTWQDADLQPGPYLLETSTLKFKLVLDNTGNVPLVNPAWSDPGFDLADCTLPDPFTPEAPPAECILTVTWAIGQRNNLASTTSTYTDTAGHARSPSDSDAACYFGAHPGVSIVKRTNGEDANAAPGPTILAGGPVHWTYVITNTGNVPIADITVIDDNGTPLTTLDDFTAFCSSTNLGPGGGQICTADGQTVIGPYANVAEVSAQPKVGTNQLGPPVVSSDLSHYFGAQISYILEKTTNGEVLDNNAPGPFIEIGQTVTWAFKVTNNGNIPLTNIQVRDDNGTPGIPSDDKLVCTISSIDPGKSNAPNSCKFTAPAVAGQYVNVGRAEVDMLDKEFSEYDYGHYYGYDPDQMLDMTVTLNSTSTGSPPGIYLPAGDDIQLLYTIYNSSQVEMTIDELTDDNGTPGDSSDDETFCQNVVLVPFSTHNCSRTVTQALVGQHTHNGHVTTTVNSAQLTHDAASSYFGVQGGITLDVHTNGQDPAAALDLLVNVDDPVTWEYFIENISNVPLSHIQLVDPPGTTVTCPASVLAIGAAMTCTLNGTAQPGAFQNNAHVKGNWPDDLHPFYADAVSYYYGVQGGIMLEFKVNGLHAVEPPGPDIIIGENALLSYVVTNTGNFPIDSISVTDNFNLISCPYTTLPAGSNMTCTANETVTVGLHSRTANGNGLVNLQPISATDKVYFTGIPPTYNVFLPLILR